MRLWKNLLSFLDNKVDTFGEQYRTFGIFGIVNYSSSYFILHNFGTNENPLMRLSALLLCIPLIFTNRWPIKVKEYLNLYWFLTLLYCLPFLGTYMLLENHISLEWLMNIPTGLFLLILLVDWTVFITLLGMGIVLGYLVFIAHGKEILITSSFSEIGLAAYIYFYAIIIGIIFARRHQQNNREKLHTMKMLGGSIAHELRTPLSALMMGAKALGRLLPIYQDAYSQAKAAKLPVETVYPDQEKYLDQLPQNMQTLSRNAHTVITMLLTNLNEGTVDRKIEPCSMKTCIEEAVDAYPFSDEEKNLVHVVSGQGSDFIVNGHKEMIKHVLFNLLKNALYAIASQNRGEIYITIRPRQKIKRKIVNQLVFKDTGPGIPAESLAHIFDRFYTKTQHGTGIGLAFCSSVINGCGGDISCDSRQGEHTTFTLSFPVIEGHSQQA